MRNRVLLSIVSAATLCLTACGGGSGRAPAAPSSLQVSGPSSAAGSLGVTSVSWSCLTRASGTGTFGTSDCPPARMQPTRQYPSTARGISAPDAPTNLTASVNNSTVVLNWVAPASGDAPTSYSVQAGSANGLSDLANFDTGGTYTTLAVLNVPAGSYYVRVRSNNSAGQSGPSNETLIVVGSTLPCTTLGAPTALSSTVNGSTVVLTWVPPAGCAPTSYIVQAGSTSGASDLANFSTGSTATTFTATNVAIGTYYVRVLSAAVGVLSAPSNEVTVTVGTVPPTNLVVGFNFYDPATQINPTTTCLITSGTGTICQARSTSYPLGTNGIVSYAWTVQYTYGTVKTLTQNSSDPTFTFTDTCGGPSSTSDGVAQPLSISLTVTDNQGNTATAVSGTGSQPPLFIRLFTC